MYNTDLPELTISPGEFERQMQMIQDAGFETISVDQLIDFMKGKQNELPANPIVVTLDDGYEDNYTQAFPILKKYGFKATLFMVGMNFDREDCLSGQQVYEMSRNGFEIAGRSMTHPDLTKLTPEEIYNELYDCNVKIEEVTDEKVNAFAYPFGFYNEAVVEAVKAVGYEAAFTVLTGLNHPFHNDVYLLRRIAVFSYTDFEKLIALLSSGHAS